MFGKDIYNFELIIQILFKIFYPRKREGVSKLVLMWFYQQFGWGRTGIH